MLMRFVIHNLIAHPLLVLCPPVGRWLHDKTAPAEDEPATPLLTGGFLPPHGLVIQGDSTFTGAWNRAVAERFKLAAAEHKLVVIDEVESAIHASIRTIRPSRVTYPTSGMK